MDGEEKVLQTDYNWENTEWRIFIMHDTVGLKSGASWRALEKVSLITFVG